MLRHGDGRAAKLRRAEENRVGSAGKIKAVQRVAVGVVVERKEIPHRVIRFTGSGPAEGDVKRGRETEALIHVVAGIVGGVDRPLHRLREIGDVERIQKFLGQHRVGNRSVLEFGVEAATGKSARGDKAFIPARIDLEGRELDRRGFLLRREGHRGRRRLGEARSGGNKRGGKPNHGQTRRAENKAR